MTVYQVRIKTRPNPTIKKVRRKLRGNSLKVAKAARKYLQAALNHDARITASLGSVAAAQLIFGGDVDALASASNMVSTLDESLASTLVVIVK